MKMRFKKVRLQRRKPTRRIPRDNGPLTRRQMEAIDRLLPPGRMKVIAGLF
jgi:hypothetical protein